MKIPKEAFKNLQTADIGNLYNALMAVFAQQNNKPTPPIHKVKKGDRTNEETRLANLLDEFPDSTALHTVMTQLKFKPDQIAECCGLPAPTGRARKLTREQKAALKQDAEMLKDSGALQAAMAKDDAPVKAAKALKQSKKMMAEQKKKMDKAAKEVAAAARKPSGLGVKPNSKALTVAVDQSVGDESSSPAVDRYQLIKQAEAEGRIAFNKLKLESGRYCMHKVYGVAKFRGTTRAEGVDVMLLEFANDIKVYVPFVCSDLVQNIETKRKQIALGRIPKGQGKVPLQEQIDARLAKFSAKPQRITTHAALVLAKVREMIPADGGRRRRVQVQR
jgi:transcription-repair coupling factor (superfamily II helicase)